MDEDPRRPYPLRPTIVLCFLALVIGMLLGASSRLRSRKPSAMASVYENSTILVSALGQYRIENGVYPNELQQLSPKYLKSIPSPKWGANRWEYDVKNNEFTLSVWESRSSSYPAIYFYSTGHEWYFDN